MTLLVQKYGGSSVGTLERIRNIAKQVASQAKQGHRIVVVVSAMYGETDRLIQLANNLVPEPNPREYDMLISTGEQVSMALLSMALNHLDCPAISLTGAQAGIHTNEIHTKARILTIDTQAIENALCEGRVVVIAGFQGIAANGEITTLGRGGSDTSAVALAVALKAQECQIYTDVDGVYTTDPNLFKEAKLLPDICFEEMLEMSSLGAKVLQMRSVEIASRHNLPIRVLSSFKPGSGTLVTNEEYCMHKRLVSSVTFSREEAMLSLFGLPHSVGIEGEFLKKIGAANIEIDMIAQNPAIQTRVDFTFTVQRKDYFKALKITEDFVEPLQGATLKTNAKVAKLSLVGIGMRSHTGVAGKMFQTLGNAGIAIHMITTSEIKISVLVDESLVERGTELLHQAFELDQVQIEAPLFIE